ncbi:MAG: hypothetical protein DSY90_15250 [Deltaproteobacteria bacterium]|nr:MAG: hypothetical protein DSY90_15250 [Deltaproteobacteria bacterium]
MKTIYIRVLFELYLLVMFFIRPFTLFWCQSCCIIRCVEKNVVIQPYLTGGELEDLQRGVP